jgi:cystathionine gamma-synthase
LKVRSRTPQTIAAVNGVGADSAFGAVTPPIHLSSTYTFEGFNQPRPYDYGRAGNPTRDLLADTIAKLELGAGAVVVSSGMAAIDLTLALLKPGDLVIAPHDCYAGTRRLLSARQGQGLFEVAFIDQSDAAALAYALARSPQLFFVESPSNPLMRVVDIRLTAAQAKGAGAKVWSTIPSCLPRYSSQSRLAPTSLFIQRRSI